jgi:Flp pilus assembly protein TadG
MRRGERGAVAVEFALVLVPLLMLIFGAIQYGFLFLAQQSGSSAAQQAARQLSVGNCSDTTQLTSFVGTRLGSSLSSGLSVSRAFKDESGTAVTAGSQQVGDRVQVTVRFNTVNMHFPFIPLPSGGTVQKSAEARVEDTTSSGACT